MADLSITATISDDDRAAIVADVVSALRPLVDVSAKPMLVDGERMAELAGVSVNTIDRLRANDTIPSVKLGARRLYDPNDVIATLKRNEKGDCDD